MGIVTAKEVTRCRVGGEDDLITVLDLGNLALTGVFPRRSDPVVSAGPLELVFSPSSSLLQLKHSFDSTKMYGSTYGYRSNLNQSMVSHLHAKAEILKKKYLGDIESAIVIDIGSNDATFLKAFDSVHYRLGVDPTAEKYLSVYSDSHINVLPNFFSYHVLPNEVKERGANLVTSIAMFYDLDDPVGFAKEIAQALVPGGVWHFEQSYCLAMLRTTGYDAICHEHLEYYSLKVIADILTLAGLKIIDLEFNDINGGSIAVTAAHLSDKRAIDETILNHYLTVEQAAGMLEVETYLKFAATVQTHSERLKDLLWRLHRAGNRISALGASTKGNVLLQYCGITNELIREVGEVNLDKYGCITPGSEIPISPESDVIDANPDFLLILPWHFRAGFVRSLSNYRQNGGKLLFPLPHIEIL